MVRLQGGDEECRKIWQVLCNVGRTEFEKVYKRLDITVEECGESFYNDKIPGVIDEFIERGTCLFKFCAPACPCTHAFLSQAGRAVTYTVLLVGPCLNARKKVSALKSADERSSVSRAWERPQW